MILVGLEAELGASKRGTDKGVRRLREALSKTHGDVISGFLSLSFDGHARLNI